jgi:hypothetical protein
MDPINPWLDAAEVRRLAERLMKPAHNPGASVTDAGFDEAFEGYASSRPPAPQPPQEVAPAGISESRAEPQSDRSPPALTPAPEPIASSARGPFLDRIHRFRDWMRHHFAATGIFILDREGAVIFDESNHGRLHFLARSLALASRRPGTSAGNVHVKIGAGATLEVIPVETAYGCLVLGAVVPESLSPASVSAVMEALTLIATPPGN